MKDNNLIKREFDIPSHSRHLAEVRQEVENVAKECGGFDESDIYQIKVAVSEAVANAIEHGSPLGELNKVHINIDCDAEAMLIEVSDQGVFKARLPVTEGRPSHRGRGIFLMTALVDEVKIMEHQSGTVVSLMKLKKSIKKIS
ncbi:MAG: ATP-binding protein [Actinomycetota bacterium]